MIIVPSISNSITGLGLADRGDLAFEIGVSEFLLGDVGGILDHFEGLSILIE